MDGGGAERELERDSRGREEDPDQRDKGVFEEHAEREHDHTEGGQRVQSAERWGEERADGAGDRQQRRTRCR